MYQSTGKIKKIFSKKNPTDKLEVRELMITSTQRKATDNNDTIDIDQVFEFVNDKIKKLDYVKVGDVVTVHFNIYGREWNGRGFATVRGYRIDKEDESDQFAPRQEEKPVKVLNKKDTSVFNDPDSDLDELPF